MFEQIAGSTLGQNFNGFPPQPATPKLTLRLDSLQTFPAAAHDNQELESRPVPMIRVPNVFLN